MYIEIWDLLKNEKKKKDMRGSIIFTEVAV